MKIDIFIPTVNRAESLTRTLQSLQDLETPANVNLSIWVVDNASTDNTKEVILSFAKDSNGKVKYLFEKKKGRNHALNNALSHAQGEIFIFTDDDITFDKSWLKVIAENFADPAIKCLTGKITPILTVPLPSWYSNKCSSVIGLVDFCESRTTTHHATGANTAISRKTFEEVGGFSVHGNLISEDTFLSRKLIDGGFNIIYEPRMIIYHHFQADRLNKTYFRRWYWITGLSISELNREKDKKEKCFFGVARWRYRRALEHLWGILANLFNEKERFYHELQFRRFLAYCSYRWRKN
jgi:glycosyltransferase involved in cell wall biosynthesis